MTCEDVTLVVVDVNIDVVLCDAVECVLVVDVDDVIAVAGGFGA